MLFFQDGHVSTLPLSFVPIESIELVNWPVRANKMQYMPKSSRKPKDITVCSLEDPGIVFTSSPTSASNDESIALKHLEPCPTAFPWRCTVFHRGRVSKCQPAERFRAYDRDFVGPDSWLIYRHCIYYNSTCVSLSILLHNVRSAKWTHDVAQITV